MRFKLAITIVIVILLMAGIAGAIYAAFPAPPGEQCPTPTGLLFGFGTSTSDHSQILLSYPLTGMGQSGAGLIVSGCTLDQDQLTISVDGPRTVYLFHIGQYLISGYHNVTAPHNQSVSIPIYTDVENEYVSVPTVPWNWTSVTLTLPSAPDLKDVTITLADNNTANGTVLTTFYHMTPSSLLPINGSIGEAWSLGIELLILGVLTSFVGFGMGRWTGSRIGYRGSIRKPIIALLGGVAYYVMVILSDWGGVSWHLGGAGSYVMVLAPVFVVSWIVSIPMGECKLALAKQNLPDVWSEFRDYGRRMARK
jgi:hypothetical protein